jgi:hypothetical protein
VLLFLSLALILQCLDQQELLEFSFEPLALIQEALAYAQVELQAYDEQLA